MNELLHKKQKYGSFLASSFMHALLLLGLYAVRTIKNNLFEEKDNIPQRQNAASVSMRSYSSATPDVPVPHTLPVKEEPQAPVLPEPKQDIETQSATNTVPEEQMVSNIPERSDLPKPLAQEKIIQNEQKINEPITQPIAEKPIEKSAIPIESKAQMQQNNTPQPTQRLLPNGIKDLNPEAQSAIGYAITKVKKKKKRKITGAQLLQAFRQAYRTEQWRETTSDSNSPGRLSNYQSGSQLVQQRAGQWKYANYDTKINEALTHACDTYKMGFYFKEEVNAMISCVIIINKDGSIKHLKFDESTGNKELDDYIMDVISTAKFAPIPDHLNCNEYKFTHKSRVFSEGRGYGKFTYRSR